MAGLIGEIAARGRITEDDVLALRRMINGAPTITKGTVDRLFDLDHVAGGKVPAWHSFYVEAITDFLVAQEEPQGYVSEANADWIIARVMHDGHIELASELDLLVTILDKSKQSPVRLVRFALDAVKEAVINGIGAGRVGADHVAGVVDAADVALLRRILYAFGGDGHIGITRPEAEVLFEINDATSGADNHPDWCDLFVKAIANNVLFVSGYVVPTRQEALRREAWLDEPASVTGFFGRMVTGVGSVLAGYGVPEAITEDDAIHGQTDFGSAERVDDEEATWLARRLARGGNLDVNERILLASLREMTGDLHPVLQRIVENAN
jgi:hypothetical protein